MLNDNEFIITKEDGNEVLCTALAILYPEDEQEDKTKYILYSDGNNNEGKQNVIIGEVTIIDNSIIVKQITDRELIETLANRFKILYEKFYIIKY